MGTYTLTTVGDNLTGTTGEDIFNAIYDAAVTDTFGANDFLHGGAGIDTLHLDHLQDVAITPPDTLWTHVSNIEKIEINTTGDGAQTITTGANFQAAFAPSGVELTTTTSGLGAINVTMTTFTGAATLRTTSTAGGQTIVTGSGATVATAISGAGALNIKGVGLNTVFATTTGAGAQTIGDGSGNGAHLAVVIAASAGGAQAITSTNTSAVAVIATSVAGKQDITTGAGADIVMASTTSAINTIDTGAGNDTITIFATTSGRYTINAGTGNDTMTGGAGNDTLIGALGNDILNGGAGNDVLNGGAGIDWAYYNAAAAGVKVNLGLITAQNTVSAGLDILVSVENLLGSNYNDTLVGNGGDNVLSGGNGNDVIVGGNGNDVLDGGAGIDWASYDTATAGVKVNLVLGTAQNTVSAGSDTLTNIENLLGSNFNDTLIGDLRNNILNGGNATDVIFGNNGNDRLNGGSGNDLLRGDAGNDFLTGGAGRDIFRLTSTLGFDRINDFSVSDDTIQLENSVFAKLAATGVLNPDNFKIATFATDANDYVVYNSGTGALLYDADGNGGDTAVQIALLGVNLALSNADFVVI